MVRPYKVKGEKRKKKEENYDKEEIEESVDDESTGSAKRVKIQHTASDTETYQLLNSDEHSNFLKKNNRNPSDYRPDIAHQAMLAILDSRLLQKLSITAVGKREKLLRVIKKPCFTIPTHWLPEDRLSHSSDKLMDIQDYANGISNDMNLVFVVGEMARGKIEKDYVEDYLSS
uniref:Nucleolar essential protein n=1 Tax=Solanum tuberosum TaxID=4113 RepID=M1CT12_SOLTU